MAESVNKSIKYYHLFNCEYNSFAELEAKLPQHVNDYNTRPMHALLGFTPNEVFENKKYGKQAFVAEIAQAKEKRTSQNKENTCGIC